MIFRFGGHSRGPADLGGDRARGAISLAEVRRRVFVVRVTGSPVDVGMRGRYIGNTAVRGATVAELSATFTKRTLIDRLKTNGR